MHKNLKMDYKNPGQQHELVTKMQIELDDTRWRNLLQEKMKHQMIFQWNIHRNKLKSPWDKLNIIYEYIYI